jgi:site-specific recombinase XerD
MLAEIERFINWQRRRNADARTWRDYQYDLKQFAEVVGDVPPASVTFHDVDRFVTSQAGRGFKPATINRRLAAIESLYAFLADDDPMLVCPVLPHRHGLREPQRLPRPVPADDLAKFFAVIAETCPAKPKGPRPGDVSLDVKVRLAHLRSRRTEAHRPVSG